MQNQSENKSKWDHLVTGTHHGIGFRISAQTATDWQKSVKIKVGGNNFFVMVQPQEAGFTIGMTKLHLADGGSLGVDVVVEEALACVFHAVSDGVQCCESSLVL